jgi:hypothetical protein
VAPAIRSARASWSSTTAGRASTAPNAPATVGTNVIFGCVRLGNDDVTDLYGRVKVGTLVLVDWKTRTQRAPAALYSGRQFSPLQF